MSVGGQLHPEVVHPRGPRAVPPPLEPVPPDGDLDQDGFDAAAGVRGELNALKLALRRVAEETASMDSERRRRVQCRLDEITAELEQLARQLEEARTSSRSTAGEFDGRIAELRAAVARLEDEITSLKTDPGRAGSDFHPLKFWLLAGVLAGLTAYLLAFYPSMIYGAVFSNLGEDLEKAARDANGMRDLFNGVLNPRALSEAAQSPSALIWVLLFTAFPLAVGIVTDCTIESSWTRARKAGALAALLALAFALDGVIAYKIAQRLHEARYLTGGIDVPWSRWTFVEDVNFWLVILLGFGAYVVWGLVLYFYLEEDRRRHPERRAIRARAEEADRLRALIATLMGERHAAVDQAKRSEAELARAVEARVAARERAHRDLATRVVDWNDLETRLDEFTKGWIRYLVHSREARASPAAAADVLASTKADLRSCFTPVAGEGRP